MSYQAYSVDGFGFSADEINTNILRVRRLLDCAPKFKKEIDDYFKESGIKEPELDDYFEYDSDYMSGLAHLIQRVIEEAEDISVDIADNFNCEWFVLLCPSYPWSSISDNEKSLTVQSITEIFQKYINILTDSSVDISYQSVENGG